MVGPTKPSPVPPEKPHSWMVIRKISKAAATVGNIIKSIFSPLGKIFPSLRRTSSSAPPPADLIDVAKTSILTTATTTATSKKPEKVEVEADDDFEDASSEYTGEGEEPESPLPYSITTGGTEDIDSTPLPSPAPALQSLTATFPTLIKHQVDIYNTALDLYAKKCRRGDAPQRKQEVESATREFYSQLEKALQEPVFFLQMSLESCLLLLHGEYDLFHIHTEEKTGNDLFAFIQQKAHSLLGPQEGDKVMKLVKQVCSANLIPPEGADITGELLVATSPFLAQNYTSLNPEAQEQVAKLFCYIIEERLNFDILHEWMNSIHKKVTNEECDQAKALNSFMARNAPDTLIEPEILKRVPQSIHNLTDSTSLERFEPIIEARAKSLALPLARAIQPKTDLHDAFKKIAQEIALSGPQAFSQTSPAQLAATFREKARQAIG